VSFSSSGFFNLGQQVSVFTQLVLGDGQVLGGSNSLGVTSVQSLGGFFQGSIGG
jgi:hypothetical protein